MVILELIKYGKAELTRVAGCLMKKSPILLLTTLVIIDWDQPINIKPSHHTQEQEYRPVALNFFWFLHHLTDPWKLYTMSEVCVQY